MLHLGHFFYFSENFHNQSCFKTTCNGWGSYLAVGIRSELVSDDHISGQQEGDPLILCLCDERRREIKFVLFHQRRTDRQALSFVECEDHPSAEEEDVNLLQQRLDHTNLWWDLWPTDNGCKGPLRARNSSNKVVKFLKQHNVYYYIGIETMEDGEPSKRLACTLFFPCWKRAPACEKWDACNYPAKETSAKWRQNPPTQKKKSCPFLW